MKVGYLGPKGTFTEYAATQYTINKKAQLAQYATIFEALEAVSRFDVEECIVPLENSIEGTVTTTIDALMFNKELFIKGEIVIAVKEDFLVRKDYNGQEITKILSHPQALAQCSQFIHKNYPRSQIVPVSSTAEAARIVAKSDEWIASLSLARAAQIYGLKPLYESVQDDKSNQTRFVIVTKNTPLMPKAGLKTSIVFSTQHKPGNLYRILDILSLWDLNMTKIESRPMKHQLGTYMFFVDLEAKEDRDLMDALKMIERKTSYFKFLGSYPVLKQPE